MVKLLLQKGLLLQHSGLHVDMKSIEACTSLHLAASEDQAAVVELLLQNGELDVNLKSDGGRTALHVASARDHAAVVELLLQRWGVDVNAKDDDAAPRRPEQR